MSIITNAFHLVQGKIFPDLAPPVENLIEPYRIEMTILKAAGLGWLNIVTSRRRNVFPKISLTKRAVSAIENKISKINAAISSPEDQENFWNSKREIVNLSDLSKDLKTVLRNFQDPIRMTDPKAYYANSKEGFSNSLDRSIKHGVFSTIPLIGRFIADYFFGPSFVGDFDQYNKLIESNKNFFERNIFFINIARSMVSIVSSQSNPGGAFFSKDHSHRKNDSPELIPIRKKIDALATRMGIEIPYKLKIGDMWGAQHRFDKKHIIWVPKNALNARGFHFYVERNALVMMHELAHLEKKHHTKEFSDSLLFSITIAILGAVYLPFLWLAFASAAAGFFLSLKIFSYLSEKEADAIACQYATDQEKLQCIYFFKSEQLVTNQCRNRKDLPFLERWKRKIQSTSCGSFRFGFHPYLSNRIRMIESTMKVKPKKYLPVENYINIRRRAYRGNEFNYWYAWQLVTDEKGNVNWISDGNGKWKVSRPIFRIKKALKRPFFFLKYHFAPRSALEDEII